MELSFKCYFLCEILLFSFLFFLLVYKIFVIMTGTVLRDINYDNVPQKWKLHVVMAKVPVSELPVSNLM